MAEQSMFFRVTYTKTCGNSLEFDDDLDSLVEWNKMSPEERLETLTERIEAEQEMAKIGTDYDPSLTVIVLDKNTSFKLEEVAQMNSSELLLRGLVK